MSPEAIVMDRLAYKFGVAMEKGYLTGTGSEQPLGVFVASDLGIPTSRDVATGNSATALTFDGLINAKYSLKAQHQANAVWLFHRDAISMIAKLKDGDGGYIWQPSVIAGQPDTILSRPLKMSEYVPNTFTTGLYVGMFADFSYYWIADSLSMQFQRLNELFSLNNQIGFIGRLETDGMPVLTEAFARVTLA
jgi:HK97 family phage major capsid protein